ncbi:formate--tetrahydrofolate ligase [Thermodesulfobacterium sp. TA1]|uniref:formate--tetrahydrofolate ligase n=1 Tax=Thermodesulfobacterium sp. TA1 TaxID=2234087 RepID=UPI00123287F4|nr:formate--tetrahydrofolate ligase [Thermodesulfobacterium sp. TA1]QER42802.1 formate--tetrahydrofolate ligase [Thermodesulfobacterium sp. TA1]
MKRKTDPTKMSTWEIAYQAEKQMKKVFELAEEAGILPEELIPYGYYLAKVDYAKVMKRLKNKPNGKYINVTAIVPTPFGEGKTTTTIGLIQGLAKKGKKVSGAIRQPSSGPTFNLKGGGTGGGLSQVIPLEKISFGLTGDINAVMNAHNLGMVALTSRLHYEEMYSDEEFAKIGLKRLNIDPKRVEFPWIIDFCAQALRKVLIGLGEKKDGVLMESKFWIAPASELMAILSIVKDLKDLRQRVGNIVLAYDKKGKPITAEDLEVAGAMTAWLVEAINPTLAQTMEGQPVFIHTGPFANIALGQSSIIADYLGLKLSDYHITESGFGAEIGYEKFWNIKCRLSGLSPQAVVLVVTLRALKYHGGAPIPQKNKPLPQEYQSLRPDLVEKGCELLSHCINIIQKSGIKPVVCINRFTYDFKEEIEVVKRFCQEMGVVAVCSDHWLKGGEGALELAEAVIEACETPNNFSFLYESKETLQAKIEKIAKEIYGAKEVCFSPLAEQKLNQLKNEDLSELFVCMAKTSLSLSDNPKLRGVPKDWVFNVRDIMVFRGARLIVPISGEINLMPGTVSNPRFRKIEVDLKTGKIIGIE